jgi:dTDP-3,4-didehydro-2,6-dideoxy-alpha-D-glucose 3-reductase
MSDPGQRASAGTARMTHPPENRGPYGDSEGMGELLVLGGSRIAERRVIPALVAGGRVGRIHVASLRGRQLPVPRRLAGSTFTSYNEALESIPSRSTVYVSLPNAMHHEWATRALTRGMHVIVDKPSTLRLADAEQIATQAESDGLFLAEASVWMCHPQVTCALGAFAAAGDVPRNASASFSFPTLPASDFRNDPTLGGGAIEDVGPYALTCCRVLLGDHAEEIVARVTATHPATGVPLTFSLLAGWGDGRSLVGQFGFSGPYRNVVRVAGGWTAVTIQRAFSTPPELECVLQIQNRDDHMEAQVAPADSFRIFLDQALDSIRSGNHSAHRDLLLDDARAMDRLRAAVRQQ